MTRRAEDTEGSVTRGVQVRAYGVRRLLGRRRRWIAALTMAIVAVGVSTAVAATGHLAAACPVAGQCGVNSGTGCPTLGPLQPSPPLKCVPLSSNLVVRVTHDPIGGGCAQNEYVQVQLIKHLVAYEAVWYSTIGLGTRWWTNPGTLGPLSVTGEGDSYQ